MEQELNEPARPSPRFSGNDQVYLAGLLLLFVGIGWEISWGMAFLVLGAILTGVSIATSFFVTYLAVRKQEKP